MEFLKNLSNHCDNVNVYYTDLVERSMFSKKDSLSYGFLNLKGKTIIEPKYTYASDFLNGKSNIIKDSVPGLLFKNGKEKLFPEYNATYWYKGDLGMAIKENKYGFINTSGKVIIDFRYDDAFPFYEGYASVKKDDKWNYVNEKGIQIFSDSLIFSYRPIIDNYAVFMVDSIKVEKKKKMITENGSRTFVEFLNKTGHIQLKEGLIDTNGNVILNPIYDEISGYYHNGYMRVRNKGKTGIINKDGEVIIALEYDNISDENNGLFLAKKSKKYGMINTNGQIIIPFDYSSLRFFKEGLALSYNDKMSQFINKKNEIVIKPKSEFNFKGSFSNNLAIITKNKKFGYMNIKGEIIIPIIYDKALPFEKNRAIVKKDGILLIINDKGEEINDFSKTFLWLERNNFIRFAE